MVILLKKFKLKKSIYCKFFHESTMYDDIEAYKAKERQVFSFHYLIFFK